MKGLMKKTKSKKKKVPSETQEIGQEEGEESSSQKISKFEVKAVEQME